MDIWDSHKLLLFIAFVIPGFITLKVYELLTPTAHRDSAGQLIDAVAFSCINYAILLAPIYLIETHHVREKHPAATLVFYLFVVLLAPVGWPILWKLLRKTPLALKYLPHPTGKAWDHVFGDKKVRHWVVITHRDGTRVGGRYDTNSFASSAPHPEQLYLQETWHVNADGGFDRIKESTAGIIVNVADVACVEFFQMEPEVGGERREDQREERRLRDREEGLSTEPAEARTGSRRMDADQRLSASSEAPAEKTLTQSAVEPAS